jgi:hypothetical protein
MPEMANFKSSFKRPIVGIIISILGISIWWLYYLHLDNIESGNAWACVPGTYYGHAPSVCTGLYNPGIKHDLIYGSFFFLIILLLLSCVASVIRALNKHKK